MVQREKGGARMKDLETESDALTGVRELFRKEWKKGSKQKHKLVQA